MRSLTVSLNAKTLPEGIELTETDEEEYAKIQELLLPLERLPAALTQMTNLTTFLLSITLYGRYKPNRDTIGPLLQSLPESCVNLELNLDRYYNTLGTGLNHVCQEIARCLPRLHHLRLNIGILCPDMLERGFSRSGFIKDEAQFHAPTYPSLKTLIINCDFWGDALTCNEDRSQPPYESDPSYPRARTTLAQSTHVDQPPTRADPHYSSYRNQSPASYADALFLISSEEHKKRSIKHECASIPS